MTDARSRIASKVRGIAAENRATQQHIADILGIDRKSANSRLNGHIPFTGVELWKLASAFNVSVAVFFPITDPSVLPSTHPAPAVDASYPQASPAGASSVAAA